MAYIANVPLKITLHDGRTTAIPPGGTLPDDFPKLHRTLAMLMKAAQVTVVPDGSCPPFEFKEFERHFAKRQAVEAPAPALSTDEGTLDEAATVLQQAEAEEAIVRTERKGRRTSRSEK